MNISRMLASAIVRRVAYVLVALVCAAVGSLLGMGQARAQSGDSIEEAYTKCKEGEGSFEPGWIVGTPCAQTPGSTAIAGTWIFYYGRDGEGYDPNQYGQSYQYGRGCEIGWEWNQSIGRCFNPEECLQRNGAANGFPLDPVSKPFSEGCFGGCELKMESGSGGCTVLGGAGGGAKHCNGVFQFTGQTCSAPPPGDDPSGEQPKEESCSATGANSGVMFCKKNDGRECYESNSGAMICWGVGETGQRSDGGDAQTRGPGNTEPTPEPPTPPEEYDPTKKGDPITSTTTTEHPNGSTTTTTTTVINNSTQHGTTPPGTPGSALPGSPDISDMEGSASGGGSCESPPVTTGDPVMGMVAQQAWETRCAVEKLGEASTVTGDVGDCNSPFTVEGNDANAQRLRAMREQICPGGAEAAAGDGNDIDWSGIAGPDSAEGSAFFGEDIVVGEDGLDMSGLGFSRTCPVIPPVNVFGQVIQFDNSVMCDWLELGGTILLILAALASVRIMAGVGT